MDEKFLNDLNKVKSEENKKNQTIEDLAYQCKELSEQNKAILSTLNDFKPELGDSSFKMLQNVLKEVQDVDIPAKVEIEKTQKVEFADKTRKFLIWFFCLSFPLILGSLGFAYWAYEHEYRPKQVIKINQEQKEWLWDYVGEMREKNPKTHNGYVLKNPYPEN